MRRKRVKWALALVAVAGVLAAGGRVTADKLGERRLLQRALADRTEPIPVPDPGSGVPYQNAAALFDANDPRALLGASDHVFFGHVLHKTGNKDRAGSPEMQYCVAVLDQLKGTLPGRVVVTAQLHEEGRDTVYVEGKTGPPLKLDQTYLFSTRTNRNGTWEVVSISQRKIPVRSAEHQASLRERFLAAKAQGEIPYRVPSMPRRSSDNGC